MAIAHTRLSRRSVLRSTAALSISSLLTRKATAADRNFKEVRITTKAAHAPLVGGGHPETSVWTFNGTVPGPEIRLRQGDRLRVTVENQLNEDTTVQRDVCL